MFKKQALPCVFVLLEKKNYETYLETINQIRCILHNKYNVILTHKVLILDFELAMQQALRQGLLGNCEIKGCWFHFCQAILRQVGNLNLRSDYLNNYDFRFWIKQFMALALIPLSNLNDAIDIILKPNFDLNDKHLEFIEYFISQWCTAKQSKQCPDIWNRHKASTRTDNASETNHSIIKNSIPNTHPYCHQVVDFFKASDSSSCSNFLRLKNNFVSSLSRSSKKQQDFDENIATTHEEYAAELRALEFSNYENR